MGTHALDKGNADTWADVPKQKQLDPGESECAHRRTERLWSTGQLHEQSRRQTAAGLARMRRQQQRPQLGDPWSHDSQQHTGANQALQPMHDAPSSQAGRQAACQGSLTGAPAGRWGGAPGGSATCPLPLLPPPWLPQMPAPPRCRRGSAVRWIC